MPGVELPSNTLSRDRASFYRDAHLCFNRAILAEDVDTQLNQYFKRTGGVGPLLFDFTDAEYIDVAALVNCVALTLQRLEAEQRTFFAYPKHKPARDFLATWRFPEAVADVTQRDFSEFLLAEDRHYLREQQTTYTGQGDGVNALEYNPDWDGHTETQRNFFEFLTFHSEDRSPISPAGQFEYAPRRLSRRWAEPAVADVLSRHIGGDSPKDEIARVIIFEAMSNAVRHPKARIIQVVSKFEGRRHKAGERSSGSAPTEGVLRICIWDDGEPIASTLQTALTEGKSIHAFRLPPFMCDSVFVQLCSFDGTVTHQRIVHQSEEVSSANASGARLLLMSLFPGVSRAVAQAVAQVKPFEESSTHDQLPLLMPSAPGIGLYALARTLLDQFQGRLVVRSGIHRLTMQPAHDAYRVQYNVRYKSKITTYPKWFPRFRGNLLTMHIPVRDSR